MELLKGYEFQVGKYFRKKKSILDVLPNIL